MAGIEPASDGAHVNLLRVQSVLAVSRPQRSHRQVADRLSRLKVPITSTTKAMSSGSLNDASYRNESYPGLTDFEARLGSEGEVGALRIGTYWFAEIVNEITLHPRPASFTNTTIVETDHPLLNCHTPPRSACAVLWPCRTSGGAAIQPVYRTDRYTLTNAAKMHNIPRPPK